MRGNVYIDVLDADILRITPAHAGKSSAPLMQSHALPGSPPPMRGKALGMPVTCNVDRITPAHAGKRFSDLIDTFAVEDHPRPCGEKTPP